MQKAIFIDRDGTLIKDVPYNANPELISLEYYAGEMLQRLKQKNYLLIIVTNQSGVARGFFKEEDICKMHNEIERKLLQYNVELNGLYYCPHLPDAAIKQYAVDCDCRKPRPGLINKAIKDLNINAGVSWMIGDILNDVEVGNSAGCKTILINNGNETEWILDSNRMPTFIADDLEEATEIILKHELAQV